MSTNSVAVVASGGPDSAREHLRMIGIAALVVAVLYGLFWAVMGGGMLACKAVIALFPESWNVIFKVTGGTVMALCATLIVAIAVGAGRGFGKWILDRLPSLEQRDAATRRDRDAWVHQFSGATTILGGQDRKSSDHLMEGRYLLDAIGDAETLEFEREVTAAESADGKATTVKNRIEIRELRLRIGGSVTRVVFPALIPGIFKLQAGKVYRFWRTPEGEMKFDLAS